MNFAPYQDESPEIERVLSPPHPDVHRTKSPNLRSPRASADLPSPSHFVGSGNGNTGFGRDVEGGHVSLGAFETSLPIRMDVEAMLAYVLLPPAGGVFLLLTEHKSDYVRYVGIILVIYVQRGEREREADDPLNKIPRLAIEHAIYSHVCEFLLSKALLSLPDLPANNEYMTGNPPHVLLVQLPLLDAVHHRPPPHRLS